MAPSSMTSYTLNQLCHDCSSPDVDYTCKELHPYYLYGAIAAICGSLFVIITYLFTARLRQHPSILIFMRCCFTLLFAMCLIVIIWSSHRDIKLLTCDQNTTDHWSGPPCHILGPTMLFSWLCSNGFFGASILDLYLSLKNPFSSPYTLTNRLIVIVIIVSAAMTVLLRYVLFTAIYGNPGDLGPFSYRADIQVCWITPVKNSVNLLNAAYIHVPIVLLCALSFFVNVYAFCRLKRGLPDTFAIRMRSVRDSFSYSVGFSLFNVSIGIVYYNINREDHPLTLDNLHTNNGLHRAFAVLLGSFGTMDAFLWYMRKFRQQKKKKITQDRLNKIAELDMDLSVIVEEDEDDDIALQVRMEEEKDHKKRITRSIARSDLKTALVPDQPKNLHRLNSEKERSERLQQKMGRHATVASNSSLVSPAVPCWKTLFSEFSIKPNRAEGTTINKALRREVLAYTTDGIAQSNDRAKKLSELQNLDLMLGNVEPRHQHYPTSIDDKHGETIQRFGIYIKYNCALLYRNNVGNIVSDSQNISLLDCFGSRGTQMAYNVNPPAAHALNRVATNLVLNADDAPERRSGRLADGFDYNSLFQMGKKRQFVDYAPLIFRYIRVKLLNMTDKEYIDSFIPPTEEAQKKVLDAKFGDGKSGAFFYFTHDSRFLVKTINKHEIELFLEILEDYVRHLKNNPNTVLSRCVGLHSLTMYGLVHYFVVMENVFLAELKPHEIYDLKGSWVGRSTEYGIQSGKVMKDNDLKRFVILSKDNQQEFLRQLKRDTKFLEAHEIMDYSLLLGIYHMKIVPLKQASRMRQRSYIQAIDDELELEEEQKEDVPNNSRNQPNMNGHGVRLSSPALSPSRSPSPWGERVSYYAGGVQAQVIEGPGIYYMGIIDSLQKYNTKKKLENWFKSVLKGYDAEGISCVDPARYRKRFMNYFEHIVINDEDYFEELEIQNAVMEKQKMYVYPPKKLVDVNLQTMRQKKRTLSFASTLTAYPSDNDQAMQGSPQMVRLMTGVTLENADAINIMTGKDEYDSQVELNVMDRHNKDYVE